MFKYGILGPDIYCMLYMQVIHDGNWKFSTWHIVM